MTVSRRDFIRGAVTAPILAAPTRAPRSMEMWSNSAGKFMPWREVFRELPVKYWIAKATMYLKRERWFRTLTTAEWKSLAGRWDAYNPHPLVLKHMRSGQFKY